MSAWAHLRAERAFLPYRIAERIRERAAMSRHRRIAEIHPSARIRFDGWIDNRTGEPHLVRIGPRTIVRGHLFVFPHGGSIAIGEWCFIGQGSRIWAAAGVTLGDRCVVSHQVNIHDTNGHSLDKALRHQHFRTMQSVGHPPELEDVVSAPVILEDDVWLGFGSSVMKGVRIGNGSVVAAGAVVLDDVPPAVVVAGNPARVVKQLPGGVPTPHPS